MSEFKIGIDLGGTKIEIAVLDADSNFVLRERVATPQGDYSGTLSQICDLVYLAENKIGMIDCLGVAIPGAVSQATGRIKNANSTCLIGQSLQQDLQVRLDKQVFLENDANCFVLSEAKDGAGKEAEVVFGVILGTGCGGGLVINKRVMGGKNSIGGEWGHNPLPWPKAEDTRLPCYCGKAGCLETFLSGPGLSQHYYDCHGQHQTSMELMKNAERGNVDACTMLERYAVWLAKGLSSVINVLDPDVIVLGGGLSNMSYLYSRVPEIWGQWVFSDQVTTLLRPPVWGDSSGVRGAAWLSE